MKVFISWSGKRSKALAIALKEWVPLIVQHAKPWVSDKDISAGDRWAQAIAGELESSNFGILCITPENLCSEWILFEAGALSKAMQDAKVIPLLFGLELSDLSGPLVQFQARKVDEQGMLDALKSINNVSDTKTDEATIERLVPALWSQLQDKLDLIRDKKESEKHVRPQTEILEDLVSQVRGLRARLPDFDPEIMERSIRSRGRHYRKFHPELIDEIVMMLRHSRASDMALLMIAGSVRDTMPWLSEILVECYRDLKNATPKEARGIAHRLMSVVEMLTHSRLAHQLMDDSKGGHFLMLELPRLIGRAIHDRIETRPIDDKVEFIENDKDYGSHFK